MSFFVGKHHFFQISQPYCTASLASVRPELTSSMILIILRRARPERPSFQIRLCVLVQLESLKVGIVAGVSLSDSEFSLPRKAPVSKRLSSWFKL
jgi:hypothetical protein